MRIYPVLVVVALALTASLCWFYQEHFQFARQSIVTNLDAVARLRADEIALWKSNVLVEAGQVSTRHLLIASLNRWLESGEAQPDSELVEALRVMQESLGYDEVEIRDFAGGVRWCSGESQHHAHPEIADLIAQAQEDGRAHSSGFYIVTESSQPQITVVAPLPGNERARGTFALTLTPGKEFYGLLERWPTPSEGTGETYLCQISGDDFQYLSPPTLPGSPRPLDKIPASRVEVSAVAAVLAEQGQPETTEDKLYTGIDYRGQLVVTAVAPVVGTSWFVVAEMDEREAYERWHRERNLLVLLYVTLLLIPLLVGISYSQMKRREYYERLSLASAEAKRVNRLYDMLLETNMLIVSARDRESLMRGVVRIAVEQGHFLFAWYGEVDEAGNILPVTRAGDDQGYIDAIRATIHPEDPRGQGPSGTVCRTGEARIFKDFLGAVNTTPWQQYAEQCGVRASGSFPVFFRGAVQGCLNFYAADTDFFGEEEVGTLQEMASDLSFAFDNLASELERDQATAEVERLSARMHFYMKVSPIINYALRWDEPTGRMVPEWVSENVERLLGYGQEEVMAPDWWYNHIHPDDRESALAASDQLAASSHIHHQYRVQTANGEWLWVLDSMEAIRGKDDELIAVVGAWADVSSQVASEQAMRASEARYRDLFENNPHPMYMYDAETLAFIAVNEAAVQRYGYSRDEFLQMNLRDIRPADEVPRLLDRLCDTSSGFENMGIWRHRLRGGEEILAEVTKHTLTYEGRRAELVLAQDVTARVTAERALQDSEERLRLALSSSGQGTININFKTGEVRTSPEYATLLGFDPETFRESDAAWIERLHPDDREAAQLAFGDCVAGKTQKFEAQFRQRTPEGGWIWIATLGRIVERDESGAAVRFAGTIADVTEAKRTEEMLRLQSASLEAAANGIVITDLDGRIIWANSAFVALTGYSLEEACGRNPRELVRSGMTDASVYKEMWDTISEGKTWHGEWINRCKDGRLYNEKVAITPVFNHTGHVTHYVAIKQDITELKRNQQDLLASQARYERILETVGLPLASSAHDGSIRFVNERFTQIFGYTREDVPSIEAWWSSAYPDATYRDEVKREWLEMAAVAAASGTEIRPSEKRITCKNGDIRVVEISGTFIGDEMVVTFNDLTARVTAGQELRNSEAYLREGEILARTGAFHLHYDNQMATYTPGILNILGLSASENISFDDVLERVLPDHQPLMLGALEECKVSDEPQLLQFQLCDDGGPECWIEGRFTHAGAAGSEFAVTGVIQDITERKKAEESIRELSEAIEQAADGIAISDLEGRIRYVNHSWAAMHGYEREALIGCNLAMFHTDNQIEAFVVPSIEALRKSGSFRAEVEHRRADGSVFPTFMTGTRLCNVAGEPVGMIGVARDISESKLTAAALRASRERLNYLIEVSPAIIYTLRAEPPVAATFISNKVREVFGYGPDDFLGAPEFWIEHVHPEDQDEARQFIEQIQHQDRVSTEYRFRNADGRYLWVHDELFVTRNAAGERIELIGAWMDVTERKRMSEMEVATIAAEAASRAKSSFLATMSHEIRTPMNGVIGTVDLLRQTRLVGDQAELVEIIRDSAHSLLAILNDILDFSKIEAGKMELDIQPLSAGDVIESLCSAMSPVALAKGVRISCFIDPRIPSWVQSDPVRVRQILSNLIGNAIKFSANACPNPRVWVRVEWIAGDEIEFSVSDNGVGMSPETIQTLFTPFTQADGSISRRFGGTGLGLSICKSLCDMLGARIQVESVLGEGTVFTVYLPVQRARSFESSGDLFDLAGIRCMLAAGDPDQDEVWRRYLEPSGALVIASITPDSVWQISRGDCDLVIVSGDRVPISDLAFSGPEDDARQRAALLVVTSDGRRCIRQEGAGVYVIYGDILRRETLLRGVAIAVGRVPSDGDSEQVALPERIEPPSIEDAAARGRLILVAEDNEINQKVIRYQLAMLDVACHMAANGEEALQLWREGRYTMLLTDLHMPVMDGYALATAIRAGEAEGEHLPIIAFTANVSRGEPERCRAAGMDGYLTKPVPLEEFKTTLVRWLPQTAPSSNADVTLIATSSPSDQVTTNILDLTALEALVGSDPGIIREFLADYLGSVSKAAGEIEEAYAASDLPRLGALAHRLKSSSRSVGALPLGECCANIEIAGKSGDLTGATEAMPVFRQLVNETVRAIVGEGVNE